MKKVAIKVIKALLVMMATFIILLAVLINVARFVMPKLSQKRVFLEKWASQAMHQPVSIGAVRATWNGLEPQFTFTNVSVHKPHQARALVRVHKISIGIDVLNSVWHWKLLPGRLFISGAHLRVRENAKGRLLLTGIQHFPRSDAGTNGQVTEFKNLLVWLLTQANVSVRNVDIFWQGQNGLLLPIHNLHLEVRNDVTQHHISGVASLQQTIPTQIKFILKLQDFSSLNDRHFQAKLYVQINRMVFSQWLKNKSLARHLQGIKIGSGVGNLRVWSTWNKGELDQVKSQVAISQLGLVIPDKIQVFKKKHLLVNHLSGNFMWNRYANGWAIGVNQLHLQIKGEYWPENQLGFRVFNDKAGHLQQWLAQVNFIRLQDLQNLAENIGVWPPLIRQWYQRLKPVGDVKNLSFRYIEPVSPQKAAHYAVFAQFKTLGFSPWQHFPGVNNITGYLYLTQHNGLLQLNSPHIRFTVPYLFNQPLSFLGLHTVIRWHKQDSGWRISSNQLKLYDNNLSLLTQFRLLIPHQGSPEMSLLAGYQIQDLKKLAKYVPVYHIRPHLSRWLRTSFLNGKLTDGELVWQGALVDFPYDKHDGQFEALAKLKDVNLQFQKKWPSFDHINGSLQFVDKRMNVLVNSGVISGNQMDHVHATIANLQSPVLMINGHTNSDLRYGHQFLIHSPLRIGRALSDVKMQGPMDLTIGLHIDLNTKEKDATTKGTVVMKDAQLQLPDWGVGLTKTQGVLNFTDQGLTAQGITANVFGKPVQLAVQTVHPKNQASSVNIKLKGIMNMQVLQKHFTLPFLKFFQGESQYQGLLKLYNNAKKYGNHLTIQSDLMGVSAKALPQPYAKTADQPRPFKLRMDIYDKKPLRLRIHYGDLASSALLLDRGSDGLEFRNGQLHLGQGVASFQQRPGLMINGYIQNLRWSQWHTFLQQLLGHAGSDKQTVGKMGGLLRVVEVDIAHLQAKQFMQKSLQNVYLKLVPKPNGWLFNVQSEKIAGLIFMPTNAKQPWRLNLMHLYFSKRKPKAKKSSATVLDPTTIPGVDFSCRSCHYNGVNYGAVSFQLSPLRHGLHIRQLKINSPLFNLSLNGDWLKEKNQYQTNIEGGFSSQNLGLFLSDMKLSNAIEGGAAGVNFKLRWPDAPNQFNLAHLSGEAKLDMTDGRILNLGKKAEDELGLGRLLNLFSLQSLPKRLVLDFGDLKKKGFKFNVLKGDFVLNKGEATLYNTYLNGPVAWVGVKGKVGFAKKDYNLNIQVAPYVTSNLPLIVGLLGGPIAGAATWVVNKVVSRGIGKAVGSHYHISGSWDKPKVVKIPKPGTAPLPALPLPN